MGCSTGNESFEELCYTALKDAGCRITNPRKAVISCLATAKKPLTAPEIYDEIIKKSKGEKNSADKVSVYRTLETLQSFNLIHRVMPAGAYIACNHQSCVNTYHVLSRCHECNKVQELDIPSEVVAPLLSHLENSKNFMPDAHLLHMEGHCVSCSS